MTSPPPPPALYIDNPSPPSASHHKKSFSFSSLHRPSGSPPRDADKGSKVKGFLGRLGATNKKPSYTSVSSSLDDKPLLPSPSSTSMTLSPSSETLKVDIRRPAGLLGPMATMLHDDDPFQESVLSAQRTVDRLSMVTTVLTGVAAGLAVAGAWIPGVGEAAGLVVTMFSQARSIKVGKVAALRLVERSAAVLTAVEQAVIDTRGVVSPAMEGNIYHLLKSLHSSSFLLSKQLNRPFLKLYLHADETAFQVAKATDDLQDFITDFQLQANISTAAWQEQSRLDHQHDLEILCHKLDDGRKDDQAMLELLQMQTEQQQEAIKTLQRTLDRVVSMQEREYSERHPASSLARPASPADLYGSDSYAHPFPPIPSRSSRFAESIFSEHSRISAFSISTIADTSLTSSTQAEEALSSAGSMESHREFCEAALDVLRRNSGSSDIGVPDWTITSLEVAHDTRISSGFFSVIWRGKWQGEDVAIKDLNSTTDRTLFVKEVEVWRKLKDSPFILPFLGASSTTGPAPWFFVSPYMRNGNILTYLRTENGSQADRIALVHQMAQGMEYLHLHDIMHGDFKAANVLVSDVGQAMICDFGLSHLKLDIATRSNDDCEAQNAVAGTMRWQSPERLRGGRPTWECDVYAFAMTVYEVYTGLVPFGYSDDFAVRASIERGDRPVRPEGMPNNMWALVVRCWSQDPAARPKFRQISTELSCMYRARRAAGRQDSELTSSTESSQVSSYQTASEGMVEFPLGGSGTEYH